LLDTIYFIKYKVVMNKKLLNQAIKKAKNQNRLAIAIGVSRSFINQVVKGVRPMSPELAKKLTLFMES
jgi:DNA-binding transcriptional regulator YdaS (Cro superfamily)